MKRESKRKRRILLEKLSPRESPGSMIPVTGPGLLGLDALIDAQNENGGRDNNATASHRAVAGGASAVNDSHLRSDQGVRPAPQNRLRQSHRSFDDASYRERHQLPQTFGGIEAPLELFSHHAFGFSEHEEAGTQTLAAADSSATIATSSNAGSQQGVGGGSGGAKHQPFAADAAGRAGAPAEGNNNFSPPSNGTPDGIGDGDSSAAGDSDAGAGGRQDSSGQAANRNSDADASSRDNDSNRQPIGENPTGQDQPAKQGQDGKVSEAGNRPAIVLNHAIQLSERSYDQVIVQGEIDHSQADLAEVKVDFYVQKSSIETRARVLRQGELPDKRVRRVHAGSIKIDASSETYRAVLDASIAPGDKIIAVAQFGGRRTFSSEPITIAFGTDDDNDGINNSVELLSPFAGDANRDGVLDHTQSDVASILTVESGDFVTLDAGGATLQTVSTLAAQPIADPDMSMPYGMLDFNVLVQPGGSAQVEVILPEEARPIAYYKQDPFGGTLVPFQFDGQTGAVINDNVVTLHFVDGGRGDADGLANGVIVDPGGAASLDGVVTLSGFLGHGLDQWDITESGGSQLGAGDVTYTSGAGTQTLVISEGDSFAVSMERPVTIPANPTELRFEYEVSFDTTDRKSINDAFEVALLDSDGQSVVPTFHSHRNSFFNHTEEELPQYDSQAVVIDGHVALDISALPVGADYRLLLRLVNNDADTGTTVTLVSNYAPTANDDAFTILEDAAPTNYDVLQNDTSFPDAGEVLAIIDLDTTGLLGTASIAGGTTIQYTPPLNFFGTEVFAYTMTDGVVDSVDQATVTFTIQPVNDPPVADPEAIALDEDTVFTLAAPGVLDGDTDVENEPLSAQLIQPPHSGTVILQPDGSIQYQPNANYFGTDFFTYQATDGKSDSNIATVSITVHPINDIVSADDQYALLEDVPLTVAVPGVLLNEPDVDGDTITAHVLTLPANGSVSLNPNGSFTYTPNLDFNGTDSFTYEVDDGTARSTPATVDLTITAVNDAPVTVNDVFNAVEDTTLDVLLADRVLINDSDVDDLHSSLTAVLVSSPANGLLTLQGDGTFSYVPNADFFGTDTFTYKASDGQNDGNVATVTINVAGTNDVPVALDDNYSVSEDTNLVTNAITGALANDIDVDGPGEVLTATRLTDPSNGVITAWNLDGSFTYQPNADFFGTDSFTYQVADSLVSGNIATIHLTVDPINDAPVAVAESYSTAEDTTLSVTASPTTGLLQNDTDVENDPITAVLVAGASHGTVTVNTDGSFVYTPDADYHGSDSFTYQANDGSADSNVVTVNLTVDPVNDAPVAANDSYLYIVDALGDLVIGAAAGVLANDGDVDGDPLTAVRVADATHGTVTLNSDGSFTYTPTPGFAGTDTFTYVANDGLVDSVMTATVTVVVDHAPVAANDSYTTPEDTPLSVVAPGVLSNDFDTDSDPMTVELVGDVSGGTLLLHANGSFDYTPAAHFFGTDTFTYKVWDGLAYSDVATATISVTSVNDPPVAIADSYTLTVDPVTPFSVNAAGGVLINDTDVESDPLTAVLATAASGGVVQLNSDGSFTYTANAGFSGVDTFTYVANDGTDDSSVAATVTLNVNNSPEPLDDQYTTDEDQPLTRSALNGVRANDADIDGDSLTVSLVTDVNHGTLSLAADGSFTYTPHANFNGTDSFVYQVDDGLAPVVQATATITVNPINDAPVAANETYVVTEDLLLTINAPGVLGNDTDVDLDPLTAINWTQPANGTLVPNADGSFTYDP
ncbi:MAG: Ig-like domain-containing protein, partial [Pirellulales bacterium]|nr:Ig-like domain-containing protein [Pirellulales bacterium]